MKELIRNADVFLNCASRSITFSIREQSLDVRDESNLNKINHTDTHYGR